MPDKEVILSEREVAEIAEMFPHAEYQPTLSPDEVGPCEFCKGTIDDHKANCVVPHVHALCATVRALRYDLERIPLAQSALRQLDELRAANTRLQARLKEVEGERDEARRKLQLKSRELISAKGHCHD